MLNTNNQNSILTTKMGLQQKLEDRRVFDKFMNKNMFVTCDKPKGYLVKENPAQQFGSAFVDTFKDVGNLGKALASGKSNDLELGRMNDVGMKVGGALIAAALMGSKATKNKKLMELVGFGTFFSVMSLWPKVAIDLPTKLIHGFNPHQKYIDSQGRKKLFFQDNQYLPWDVWTKEDINKVADKMNIPKDIKDREEYTKEKMRTIALQGNTLWMLTAGFASPLLTSLACNKIENAMAIPVAQNNLKKVAKNMDQFDSMVEKVLNDPKAFEAQDKEFEELITTLKSGQIPENFEDRLGRVIDIRNLVEQKEVEDAINPTNLEDAKDIIERLFKESDEFGGFDEVEKLIKAKNGSDADVEQAKELFKKAFKQLKDNNPDAEINWRTLFGNVLENLDDEAYEAGIWSKIELDDIPETKVVLGEIDPTKGVDALEKLYNDGIKRAQAQVKVFGKQMSVLSEVSGEKYNLLSKTFLKKLGFTNKEIKELINTDPETFRKRIAEKLSSIAGDEKKTKELTDLLSKRDKQLKEAGDTTFEGVLDKLKGKVQGAMKRLFKKGENFEESTLPEALKGSKIEETLSLLNDRGVSSQAFERSKLGMTSVESVVSKFFSAMDFEKRIQSGEVKKALETIKGTHGCTKSIDELLDICRKTSWCDTYGDAMNKSYFDGNGGMYEDLINLIFKSPENIGDNDSLRKIAEHNEIARRIYLGEGYIPNPELKGRLDDSAIEYLKKRMHSERFADFGESLSGTLKKQTEQLYNNKTWMKVFGGLTVALLGVTFISQLFFGKVKDSHLYQKQQQQDTFNKNAN